ncbi:hypothetical protein BURPS1710A_4184 [Burkholderia pseudomallei 1710a]|uniref:Uncharacterized protein n=1 Tax=Burkholderia pseudomallei 1710a TaxID=320371 RepID=A0A0E1WAV1_BURPE|nr:hypothetical protein BURPS1710A_4184 [Burkholderia pseudomallei 1710a]
MRAAKMTANIGHGRAYATGRDVADQFRHVVISTRQLG